MPRCPFPRLTLGAAFGKPVLARVWYGRAAVSAGHPASLPRVAAAGVVVIDTILDHLAPIVMQYCAVVDA